MSLCLTSVGLAEASEWKCNKKTGDVWSGREIVRNHFLAMTECVYLSCADADLSFCRYGVEYAQVCAVHFQRSITSHSGVVGVSPEG